MVERDDERAAVELKRLAAETEKLRVEAEKLDAEARRLRYSTVMDTAKVGLAMFAAGVAALQFVQRAGWL